MAGIQLESGAVKQQEQEVQNKYNPKNDSVFLELLEYASWLKIADDFSSGLKNNWIEFIFRVELWEMEVTCTHAR